MDKHSKRRPYHFCRIHSIDRYSKCYKHRLVLFCFWRRSPQETPELRVERKQLLVLVSCRVIHVGHRNLHLTFSPGEYLSLFPATFSTRASPLLSSCLGSWESRHKIAPVNCKSVYALRLLSDNSLVKSTSSVYSFKFNSLFFLYFTLQISCLLFYLTNTPNTLTVVPHFFANTFAPHLFHCHYSYQYNRQCHCVFLAEKENINKVREYLAYNCTETRTTGAKAEGHSWG